MKNVMKKANDKMNILIQTRPIEAIVVCAAIGYAVGSILSAICED